jgi:hypothetical protein
VALVKGGEDTEKKLLRQIRKEAGSNPTGSAFRWAVGANTAGGVELMLQVLPLPAATINSKPVLLADNMASKVLQSWRISTETFDGEVGLRGPVPTIFTEQPEELRTMLDSHPGDFMLHLNKAMKW